MECGDALQKVLFFPWLRGTEQIERRFGWVRWLEELASSRVKLHMQLQKAVRDVKVRGARWKQTKAEKHHGDDLSLINVSQPFLASRKSRRRRREQEEEETEAEARDGADAQ